MPRGEKHSQDNDDENDRATPVNEIAENSTEYQNKYQNLAERLKTQPHPFTHRFWHMNPNLCVFLDNKTPTLEDRVIMGDDDVYSDILASENHTPLYRTYTSLQITIILDLAPHFLILLPEFIDKISAINNKAANSADTNTDAESTINSSTMSDESDEEQLIISENTGYWTLSDACRSSNEFYRNTLLNYSFFRDIWNCHKDALECETNQIDSQPVTKLYK